MNFKSIGETILKIKYIKDKILISIIILIIGIIMCSLISILGFYSEVKFGAIDILYSPSGSEGVLGSRFQTIVIIPIFTFLVSSIINIYNNPFIIIKNTSRVNLWDKQIKDCILFSLLFVIALFILGYLIAGFLAKDFNSYFSSKEGFNYLISNKNHELLNKLQTFSTLKIMLISFISLFLGLSFISILIATLKIFFKSKYVVSIIVLLTMCESVINIKFVVNYTTMNLNRWMNYPNIIIENMFLLGISIIIYFIGRYLINKKDFLLKKEF